LVKPIPQPQATPTLGRACLLTCGALTLLLGAGGCGSPNHGNFWEPGESAGSSNAGAPSAGSGSAGSANAAGSSGTGVSGGGGEASTDNGGSGGNVSGCAFSCGDGGRGGANHQGGSGDVGGVGSDAGSGSTLTDCSAFAAEATFNPATQHCYLVDSEPRTFAAAQTHCTELKAHLLTLSNEAENDFAWGIHSDEHWIGARDGKAPKQSGVGTYGWVTDEPFSYENWSQDQPNASKTECVDGGSCYEHCAFQWKGGEHDSQWNDRYCMHTVASICEWDSAP